jgi:NTE family protein
MHPMANRYRPRTAFVLAGGGSLGAAQIGMLRALLERGIKPDLVVGSSVGAINAAYFAGSPTLEGLTRLEALWRNLKRTDVLPLSWRGVFGLLRRSSHLVSPDGLRRLLDTHLPYQNLEDAPLPVHVVATDILSGQPVVLSRGPVARAVIASSAIPGAFAPVEIDGRLLCDGAVASNTPVHAAVRHGARRLFVLPTGSVTGLPLPPVGVLANAVRAIGLLTQRQLAVECEHLRGQSECYVLPAACPPGMSPLDFSRTPELIARAYDSTCRWIEEGGMAQPNLSPARLARRRTMVSSMKARIRRTEARSNGSFALRTGPWSFHAT